MMTDKQLTLNQQIALLPVAIPDAVLDLLEDFNYPNSLELESVRNSFDSDYLRDHGEALKEELELLRREMGKVLTLQVEAAGRDIPSAYICKLGFELSTRGLGIVTKLKDKTILRVVVQKGDYNEEDLKKLLRS